MPIVRTIAAPMLALLLVVLAPVAPAPAGTPGSPPPRITVTGTGTVKARPDMAVITLGVASRGQTAAAALQANSRAVAAVLSRLKAAGIAPGDLQTSGLSLAPVWDQRMNATPSEAPRIIGYQVRNTITVRVRALQSLGQILDAVVQEGANTFSGLRLSVSDPAPLADAARESAVRDAIRKARGMAAAAGLRLGPVIAIREAAAAVPRPVAMRSMEAAADAVPVEAGEVSVRASVTVEFALLAAE